MPLKNPQARKDYQFRYVRTHRKQLTANTKLRQEKWDSSRPVLNDKKCCACKQTLVIEFFALDRTRKDGYSSRCRFCRARLRKPTEAKPERRERSYFRNLLRNTGCTEEYYKTLLAKQRGLCAICDKPQTDKRAKRLAADHDHVTGRVRELLCTRCNVFVGLAEEDMIRLERTKEYLGRHSKEQQ